MKKTQQVNDTNRWTLKNVITMAIFTAIIFVIMMIWMMLGNVLFTPVGAYFASAGLSALFAGPFYMVMADKIAKRGVVFSVSLITGLLFLVMGQVYTFAVYALFGILGEACMWGKNTYQSFIRNFIGFSWYMLALSAGGFLPMILFRERFIAWYSTVGNAESVAAMTGVYGTAHGILINIGLTLAGTLLGSLIGRSILNRHVKKARI